MTSQQIPIGGGNAVGYVLDLPGAPLVVAKSAKGFVMCGYLDVAVADKFGTAAAVVRGVKSVDDLLAAKVTNVSAAGAALGAAVGMTGREVLEKFS